MRAIQTLRLLRFRLFCFTGEIESDSIFDDGKGRAVRRRAAPWSRPGIIVSDAAACCSNIQNVNKINDLRNVTVVDNVGARTSPPPSDICCQVEDSRLILHRPVHDALDESVSKPIGIFFSHPRRK
jgi:hypothetical protein